MKPSLTPLEKFTVAFLAVDVILVLCVLGIFGAVAACKLCLILFLFGYVLGELCRFHRKFTPKQLPRWQAHLLIAFRFVVQMIFLWAVGVITF